MRHNRERLLTEHNYDKKKRLKIFNCNLNITKHTNSHIVVTNKDTGSKNKRK